MSSVSSSVMLSLVGTVSTVFLLQAVLGTIFGPGAHFGVLLDPRQLTPPMPGERAAPLVDRAQRIGVGAIEDPAAVATEIHEAHVTQDLQVLRDGRLRDPEHLRDVADRPLLRREVIENVAAAALRDRVERIRRGGGPGHDPIIFPYRNMSNPAS